MPDAEGQAGRTNLSWGKDFREQPGDRDKQTLNPVLPDSAPAKINNGHRTVHKIPANSHPIPTNCKATPIHLSLGAVNNPVVNTIKSGVSLTVTPTINADGRITMKIVPDVR